MLVRDLMAMLRDADQDAVVVLRCDDDVELQAENVLVEDGRVALDAFYLVSAGYCEDFCEALGAL